jgi:hypothetical protein
VDKVTTATADASDDIKVPAGDVKPEEIAALAAQTADDQADDTTDEDEASIADSLDNADKSDQHSNLAEMASLDVPKDTTMATRSFVLPSNVADELDSASVEPKSVKKGGRPTRNDVEHASDDSSTHAEPKLTKNLIAEWALNKGRFEVMAKPVKAPRFVSRTLRKQPTEVYSEGFEANAVQIDPARFSGTAVNFMPVKKFETN